MKEKRKKTLYAYAAYLPRGAKSNPVDRSGGF